MAEKSSPDREPVTTSEEARSQWRLSVVHRPEEEEEEEEEDAVSTCSGWRGHADTHSNMRVSSRARSADHFMSVSTNAGQRL